MTGRWDRMIRWTLLALGLAIVSAVPVAANQLQYVYDAAGRLVEVIDPSGPGTVVQYVYDAAGNLVAVHRAALVLSVLDFAPKIGGPGDRVTITGTGFDPTATTVAFNGTNAAVVSVTPVTVVATVPDGAATGKISITTSRGTVQTADPFIVATIAVTPGTLLIAPGAAGQFTAKVSATGIDPTVTWSVNGVAGGNAANGTISSTGLYSAPGSPVIAVVRATFSSNPSLFGEATVFVDASVGTQPFVVAAPPIEAMSFGLTGASAAPGFISANPQILVLPDSILTTASSPPLEVVPGSGGIGLASPLLAIVPGSAVMVVSNPSPVILPGSILTTRASPPVSIHYGTSMAVAPLRPAGVRLELGMGERSPVIPHLSSADERKPQ